MIYNVALTEMEKINKPLIINNNRNKKNKYIIFVTISSILMLSICCFLIEYFLAIHSY